MTLPELLVAIVMLGLLMTVLSSAIIVTLRQQDNTEGRLNVARAEQTISMWIPADLASADIVDTSPEATPCGATVCDGIDLSGGSNVMMLTWTLDNGDGTVTTTNVSYHFAPSGDGETYNLSRVECQSTNGSAWVCSSKIVLRDLPGPPAGEAFVPGVANGEACSREVDPVPCTRPTWVIIVSEPLAADAITEGDFACPTPPPGQTSLCNDSDLKDANRVIVSINGGGDSEGAGGGINQISITAGGTVRTTIDAKSVQGTPSFVEARSRCGGPITLVIDESGSIGSTAINDVKAGVRKFVEAVAGTPVKLQVVRFDTKASILGSSEWHHYFDMTNEADVNALLAAINGLSSKSSTNWEDALFRTFYESDGSITTQMPETVVFFTDGVPTTERLANRNGSLPAEPAAPGAPWPNSNGSVYNQVGFNRADYIANKFRRSVRMIGVGVGPDLSKNSTWISNPGAGYTLTWERGSYSYVKDTFKTTYVTTNTYEYELRYQVKPSRYDPDSAFYWVSKNTWENTNSNRRRDLGWTVVSESVYRTVENPPNDSSSDGSRRTVVSTTQTPVQTLQSSAPVSTAEYNANSTNPAYRAVGKTWAAGPDWEPWTGSRSSGSSSQYRSTKVYNSPPYTDYDPAVTAQTKNSMILARMIAGNDYGTPANWDGTRYTNATIADMYTVPNWSDFSNAMEAVALGECGGTLTLQTKVGGTTPAPDTFRYQNSQVVDSGGVKVEMTPTVVTTNQQFYTGTFDFAIPNGEFVTVDVFPQNYSELIGYTPGAWSCRAGNQPRLSTEINIPEGGLWKGVRVKIAANEAVSCTLSVSK